MVHSQTKNPNLGKIWWVLQWKMLVNLWPHGLFYCHFVYFMVILVIFSRFGIFHKEKSGNPGAAHFTRNCNPLQHCNLELPKLANLWFVLECSWISLGLNAINVMSTACRKLLSRSGANPTTASYNSSAVKKYNATSSLVHFENKNISFYF
jgi:hypothetical protein